MVFLKLTSSKCSSDWSASHTHRPRTRLVSTKPTWSRRRQQRAAIRERRRKETKEKIRQQEERKGKGKGGEKGKEKQQQQMRETSALPTRGRHAVKASTARREEGPKVATPSAPVFPLMEAVLTGLPPPPRLPVVEVDYPVDFMVKPVDGPRAIPVGESFEKRRSVQCLPPLESSLRGRSSQAVRL